MWKLSLPIYILYSNFSCFSPILLCSYFPICLLLLIIPFLRAVATKDHIEAMGSDGARLVTAALENDMNSVKGFLNKDIEVDSRDWDNMTALIAASSKG